MLRLLYERKSVFRIPAEGIDPDELELELIDVGGDEIEFDEEADQLVIYGEFTAFGSIQKFMESKGYEIKGAEFQRIPNDTKALTDEEVADVEKLLDKLDEDDDVQSVYHNMKEE